MKVISTIMMVTTTMMIIMNDNDDENVIDHDDGDRDDNDTNNYDGHVGSHQTSGAPFHIFCISFNIMITNGLIIFNGHLY